MMRSPPSAERPVVSVSSTIWRMARLCLTSSSVTERHMFDLTGKVALVTGGNGGIGLGMAGGLAEAGAKVILSGRNSDKSAAAVDALRSRGFNADAIEADVTDEAEVAQLFQQVMLRHGRLDILVNNAGT